ncbi:GNAT family N-acetyltransferase [Ahniella affigens]|uniref:GNAT family N-acetyltransferase n=1 Tax=Ahniella affigens TaxID=2021234 RepID=A0A2P1PXX2_9GAMM|nr:GNAT family N-acetyltransferase [Ahniella affigens]AVP99654.1 GNAT family N-acetyltransferase [Ahniella affigens]
MIESDTSLRFRPAHYDDIPAIVALVESAYRGDASRIGWTTEAEFLEGQRTDAEGVREILEQPDSVILLAERGSDLLACINVQRLPTAGYFGMFSVRPNLQGQGIGDALLKAAEAMARDEWHHQRMTMSVFSIRPELIAYYERRGYRRTGETKPFPYGDARFGLPKRDDLVFEVFAKAL